MDCLVCGFDLGEQLVCPACGSENKTEVEQEFTTIEENNEEIFVEIGDNDDSIDKELRHNRSNKSNAFETKKLPFSIEYAPVKLHSEPLPFGLENAPK